MAGTGPGAGAGKEREPFPALDDSPPSPNVGHDSSPTPPSGPSTSRDRRPSTAVVADRLRGLSRTFEASSVPTGFMAATGTLAADVVTLTDQQKSIRRDSGSRSGSLSTAKGGESRRGSVSQSHERIRALSPGSIGTGSPDGPSNSFAEKVRSDSHFSIPEESSREQNEATSADLANEPSADAIEVANYARDQVYTEPFDNGYHFPPAYSALENTRFGILSLWHYFLTPLGFFVVIYGLNVVAWGGMLFLLLCNASSAMCYGGCDYIDSPRRIWVEIDSQILNALFCVTGFGLIPWRFRDLYYLLQYRIQKNELGLRRLGGIHRGWFRLPGSRDLPVQLGPDTADQPEWSQSPEVPFPASKIPDAPRTGVRAPATKLWKLDFVIWSMVINTFLQACLSGCMWGLNRYNRPGWTTGFLVALACIVAAMGGIMMFIEGKNVKSIEGVPLTERDIKRLEHDRVLGIPHYNNIKDKKPKEEQDVEARPSKSAKSRRKYLRFVGRGEK